MRKRIIVIVSIFLTILIVFGLYSSYTDSNRVRTGMEPKLVIKVVSDDETKITYYGLGYKVIRYVSENVDEPYKNNHGVKFGSWFMKYELEGNREIFEIVDTTKEIKDFACADALEPFYEDDEFTYYYSCIKSSYVVVRYKNGFQQTVENALKNRYISIEDLDKYNIDYIKYEKEY